MISVCVATYNGQEYIAEQLHSILSQLTKDDEVIVADDRSTDGTVETVNAIDDSRVKVIINEINLGHVHNFEGMLSIAKGDFIFFCDQDDVWCSNKVESIITIFDKYPGVSMVHHGFSTIDAYGSALSEKTMWKEKIEKGGGYIIQELISPSLFGSCLAIRKNVVNLLVPFPSSAYAHDHWLAIVGGLFGGIYYCAEQFVRRRLHGKNLTPRRGLTFFKRLRVRALFLHMICVAVCRVILRPNR